MIKSVDNHKQRCDLVTHPDAVVNFPQRPRLNELRCSFSAKYFLTMTYIVFMASAGSWHEGCVRSKCQSGRAQKVRLAVIEFRWVVFLVLWTLLIGPVLNLAKQTPSSQTLRAKTATVSSTMIR